MTTTGQCLRQRHMQHEVAFAALSFAMFRSTASDARTPATSVSQSSARFLTTRRYDLHLDDAPLHASADAR